jgi:hypothetical protein
MSAFELYVLLSPLSLIALGLVGYWVISRH